MTEVNYNLTGFLTAVASTAIFAGQNIYSKVLFQVFSKSNFTIDSIVDGHTPNTEETKEKRVDSKMIELLNCF
jgi:hypothetical protein